VRPHMSGTAMREVELQEWEIAGHILADYGALAGDFVRQAVRTGSHDPETIRRWFSIMDKMQELNGPAGPLQ
jgi:hypothetical protein